METMTSTQQYPSKTIDPELRRATGAALFALMLAAWGWLKWCLDVFQRPEADWLSYPLWRPESSIVITPDWLLLLVIIVLPIVAGSRLAPHLTAFQTRRLCRYALVFLDGSALLLMGISIALVFGEGGSLPIWGMGFYAFALLPVPLITSLPLIRALHQNSPRRVIDSQRSAE